MTPGKFRFSAGLALGACLVMAATPAAARGRGGWGHGYHHNHHDDIDADEIFAGLFVIGAIAAVASAANRANQQNRAPDYRYPGNVPGEPAPHYGENRETGSRGSYGIGDAVDRCVGEVERGDRKVESVDMVNRDGDGWRISGYVSGSREFACSVSSTGHIRSVTLDGRAPD